VHTCTKIHKLKTAHVFPLHFFHGFAVWKELSFVSAGPATKNKL